MNHLFASAVFGGFLFLVLIGMDYLTFSAFGWPMDVEFNIGMALGNAIGFWNWADQR